MIYKTYNCNSFKVHTIKTDRFKTAHMEIIFRKSVKKEELCSYAFLMDMLSESTKDYPTHRDLIVYYEELYKSGVYGITARTGNVLNCNLIVDFINPNFIEEDDYLEKVIKLPFQILLEPNTINDEFDLKQFNIIKERIKRNINSIKDIPSKLAFRNAFTMMDNNSPTSYPILGTIEDLEKITPSSLYKTYKSFFKECVCDIFIIGNIDMDEVVTLIKKYFKHRYINNTNLMLPVDNKERKKEIVGSDTSDNIQANMVMLYNLVDLNEFERHIVFQVYNYIFGNGGLTSKLYTKIREENSLCYSISSMYMKYDRLLVVHLALENENVKKASTLIKKCIKEMIEGNFSDEEIEDAKLNLIMSLDMSLDNNVSILNNYVFNEFDDLPEIEQRKDMIKKVTKDDIIRVAKKIKLNTVYVLEGKGEK